jgi:hypothetical protein
VNFASVEDVIIHKIVAGRERDLEDVRKIILKNEDIDFEYIFRWLEFFESILEEKLTQKFLNIKSEVGI